VGARLAEPQTKARTKRPPMLLSKPSFY
jgi:hypothetical protein